MIAVGQLFRFNQYGTVNEIIEISPNGYYCRNIETDSTQFVTDSSFADCLEGGTITPVAKGKFQIANSQMLIEYYERQARAAVVPEDRETFLYGRETAIERAGTLQFFPDETATVTFWTPLAALPGRAGEAPAGLCEFAAVDWRAGRAVAPAYCPLCGYRYWWNSDSNHTCIA